MTMMTPIEGITAPLRPGHPAPAAPHAAILPARHAAAHDDDDDDRPYGTDALDLDDLEEDFARAVAAERPALTPSRRADGWTPERQRGFLDYLAQGCSVSDAATLVGMSATAAYAFRKRAAGAAFAVGWHAAQLLQRNRLADDLMGRALRGNVDTVTNHRGETIERHRHDNRLALALLTRLDRIAAADLPDRTGDARAARLAAQDWDRYLDLIGADASPAQAGLFLSLRTTEGEAGAIAPIVALARADLYRRTGAGHAGELSAHDLDPAQRHAWTAADWARAEGCGLVTLAAPAPPESPGTSQLPQHSPWREPEIWWCEDAADWRTAFPPPADFDGVEDGDYGDEDYTRALSDTELAVMEGVEARAVERQRVREEAARVRFFAGLAGEGEADDGEPLSEAVEGEAHPLPVRAEPVEACPERLSQTGSRRTLPFSSGRKDEPSGGATPSPQTVRAEPVEALPFSSGRKDEPSGGATPPPQTVRAEPVEAPFSGPRTGRQEEGQSLEKLRANGGCAVNKSCPTGPDAGVNPASSDGAMAPPAGAGACGRVRSFATA